MPLWQIYHPVGTFKDSASKQALAEDITNMYTGNGLPSFYVVAQFHQMAESDVWVGGKPKVANPFIRVVITQIAVRLPNEDVAYNKNTTMIDNVLKPHIADKGYDWEYHVDETERRLWKINGMIPPLWKSEEEKLWSTEDRPVPYDGAYARV
jgi:phenylpyruvate tautomerase PptA (4-oxalocrotonate tautomerase family)